MTKKQLAKYIDSTILKQDASKEEIIQLCLDAKKYGFKSVCINPYYINLAKQILNGSDVLICTVIGFPLGMNTIETKIFEAKNCIDLGVDEIDMVINVSNLKKRDIYLCINEINDIKSVCQDKTLKVIVETAQLDQDEKIFAAELISKSNADFIKTSTGFAKSGANIDDVKLWKSILNSSKQIKAAGGIKTLDDCINFIKSGANRIGTSNAKSIIEELKE